MLGGIVVPLDRLPDGVAAVAGVLPPAALTEALAIGLGHASGDAGPVLALLLAGWAVVFVVLAALAVPLGLSRAAPRPRTGGFAHDGSMTDAYAGLADAARRGRARRGRPRARGRASGGNLSARCPDRDAFLVTGAGTWLDRPDPRRLRPRRPRRRRPLDGPEPSSEWRLHRATYRVRPDVQAVVHLHPQTAVVLDALGHRVRVLTLDHATYLRRIERIPYFPNGSDELADASAEAPACDVIVLANHGCSTRDTVEMAWRRRSTSRRPR